MLLTNDNYPRKLSVNFRKLDVSACRAYLHDKGIHIPNGMTPQDCAIATARHFSDYYNPGDEGSVLRRFVKRLYKRDFISISTSRKSKRNSLKRDRAAEKRKRTGRLSNYAKHHNETEDNEEEEDDDENDDQSQRYCICKGFSYGEMIGCDNENCPHGEWFHLRCVGLTIATKPSGKQKWYCPRCAADMETKKLAQKSKPKRKSKAATQKLYREIVDNVFKRIAEGLPTKSGGAHPTIKDVWEITKKQFYSKLGWDSPSDGRRSVSWKNHIKKILLDRERFEEVGSDPVSYRKIK